MIIGPQICAPMAHNDYDLWNIKVQTSKLIQIDAKTVIMDLTFILRLIWILKDKNNVSCKNCFQPR